MSLSVLCLSPLEFFSIFQTLIFASWFMNWTSLFYPHSHSISLSLSLHHLLIFPFPAFGRTTFLVNPASLLGPSSNHLHPSLDQPLVVTQKNPLLFFVSLVPVPCLFYFSNALGQCSVIEQGHQQGRRFKSNHTELLSSTINWRSSCFLAGSHTNNNSSN